MLNLASQGINPTISEVQGLVNLRRQKVQAVMSQNKQLKQRVYEKALADKADNVIKF